MLYLIVVLIYSLIVKTTAPYEEEEYNNNSMIVKFIGILMTDSYLGGGIPSFLELRLGM